jgi:hypothetical protein
MTPGISVTFLAHLSRIEFQGSSSDKCISIYQAFVSAAKTSAARDDRMNEIIDVDSESKLIKSEANGVEEVQESHR